MNKYPTNNEEYLSRCPEMDGVDKYGLKEYKPLTHEERQEIIRIARELRELIYKPYTPS